MNRPETREQREQRSFSQVVWFVVAASALVLVPWHPRDEHVQDACTRGFGRFAAAARAYCPTPGPSARGLTSTTTLPARALPTRS